MPGRFHTNQKTGENVPLNKGFVRKVTNFINNFEVRGSGATYHFDGVKPIINLSRPRSQRGGLAFPCVTTGAPTDGIYPVTLHANGKNAASTGTGELELLSVHLGDVLPSGTGVLGFEATVRVTGGS